MKQILLIAGGFFSTPRESLNTSQQIYEMKQVQLDLVKSFQQIIQWNPVAAFFASIPGQVGTFPDIIKVFSEYDISIFLCNDNPDFSTLQKVYDEQYGDPDPGNPEWEYRVPRQMNQRKWFKFKDAEPDNPTFENGLKKVVKIYERMRRVTATLSGGSNLSTSIVSRVQPAPDTPFPNYGQRTASDNSWAIPNCQPVAIFGTEVENNRYNFVNQPTEEVEESVFPSEYIIDLTNGESEPGLFLYNGGMSIIWMFRKRSNLVDIPPSPRSNNPPNSADPFYNWLFYSYQIEPLAFRVVFRMETVIIPNDSYTKLFGIAVSTGFEITFPEMIIEGNSEEDEITKEIPKGKLPIHPHKKHPTAMLTELKFTEKRQRPHVYKFGIQASADKIVYRGELRNNIFTRLNNCIPEFVHNILEQLNTYKSSLTEDQKKRCFQILTKVFSIKISSIKDLAFFLKPMPITSALSPTTSQKIAEKYKYMDVINKLIERNIEVPKLR